MEKLISKYFLMDDGLYIKKKYFLLLLISYGWLVLFMFWLLYLICISIFVNGFWGYWFLNSSYVG